MVDPSVLARVEAHLARCVFVERVENVEADPDAHAPTDIEVLVEAEIDDRGARQPVVIGRGNDPIAARAQKFATLEPAHPRCQPGQLLNHEERPAGVVTDAQPGVGLDHRDGVAAAELEHELRRHQRWPREVVDVVVHCAPKRGVVDHRTLDEPVLVDRPRCHAVAVRPVEGGQALPAVRVALGKDQLDALVGALDVGAFE